MKTDTEPKENNCKIKFHCHDSHKCALNPNENNFCNFQMFSDYCGSTIAQVSALTIRLQELTGKKVGLG